MRDEAFERFRRKLADVVTVAINSGKRVGPPNEGCYCPLGCLPGIATPNSARGTRPAASDAAKAWGFGGRELGDFIAGFDYGGHGSGRYFELGKLYRARFP